ncbi:hypothetical protein AB0J90_26760 [Micromonospora sp. NPDC049523]|uniref:hypothetical protein n=1 Tax=Micromonospora sp. NPDC049523 TaxID=3155921 RepID=UPI00343BAF05
MTNQPQQAGDHLRDGHRRRTNRPSSPPSADRRRSRRSSRDPHCSAPAGTSNATLAALPPAEECSDAAERFALLRAAEDGIGGEVYVELDHCQRVLTTPLTGPPILAQADNTLVELLSR